MKIDTKTKKILYELYVNSRINLNELAKKIFLSKEGTFARIKQLEKQKYIIGYVANINLEKIGYFTTKIFVSFYDCSPQKQNEIIDWIIQKDAVTNAAVSDQEEKIILQIKGKSKRSIDYFLTELKTQFEKYIIIEKITIPIEMENYEREYLNNNNKALNQKYQYETLESIPLSDEDENVLQILSQNPKISGLQLAQQINCSPLTAIRKIKEFTEKKIIRNYSVIIDLNKLGFLRYKVEIQLTDSSQITCLRECCRNHPNIIYFLRCIDVYDAEIKIECQDTTQLNKIIIEIKKSINYKVKKINIYSETKLLKVKYL